MLFRRSLVQVLRFKSSLVSENHPLLHFDHIPSPGGLPFFGTTLSLLFNGSTPNLHKYIDGRHKELGPIFKEKIGPVSCVFVADPDDVRTVFAQEGKYPMHVLPEAWMVYNRLYGCPRGLFFMDGERWWHHRRIMNNFLLKGDKKWIEGACEFVSDRFVGNVRRTSGVRFDNLDGVLYKWSLDVMVATLLGAECYVQSCEHLEPDAEKLAETVHLVFQTTAKLSLIPASIASKLCIPRWTRFVDSVNNALTRADLLVGRMMDVVDKSSNGLLPKLMSADIDPEDVKRIIVDLILAAGDTTAVATEWVLYLLAKHPSEQDRLRANPDYFKYIFKETQRLYPVAPFLTRILPEDAIVGGYAVPKNTLIIMSIYTTGRDERYFKNPTLFIPSRWDREGGDYNTEMQKATLPFAMGLRSCIGKRIAETQIQMTVLKIVNEFQVELCSEKNVESTLKMVTVPSEPLQIRFRKL